MLLSNPPLVKFSTPYGIQKIEPEVTISYGENELAISYSEGIADELNEDLWKVLLTEEVSRFLNNSSYKGGHISDYTTRMLGFPQKNVMHFTNLDIVGALAVELKRQLIATGKFKPKLSRIEHLLDSESERVCYWNPVTTGELFSLLEKNLAKDSAPKPIEESPESPRSDWELIPGLVELDVQSTVAAPVPRSAVDRKIGGPALCTLNPSDAQLSDRTPQFKP